MLARLAALATRDKSECRAIGAGPTITLPDAGKAGNFSTASARDEIDAFFFDREGPMPGMGIRGTEITRLTSD